MKRDWVALALDVETLVFCACGTVMWLGYEKTGWFLLGIQVGGLVMRWAHRVSP